MYMSSKTISRINDVFPSFLDDFFKPWNEKFSGNIWGKMLTVPAVNIKENKDLFTITMAVPGMKKEDFKIDLDGHMITVSSEKEEKIDEKEENLTRYEYNFSSFSRSFTMPEEVDMNKIEAKYENGILSVHLPKKEDAKNKMQHKSIKVS